VGQDHVGHGGEVRVQQPQHLLGREALGQRGEAAEVRHEERDGARLAAEPRPLGRGEEPGDDVVAQVAAEQRADEPVAHLEIVGEAADLLLLPAQLELRLDAGEHDAEVERLRDVVVRAELQGLDDVLARVARGRHDHGQVGRRPALAHPLQDLDAGEPGHHHVEQDEVVAAARHQLERHPSVVGGVDGEAAPAESPREHVAVELVVVDHQQPHGRRALGRRRLTRVGGARRGLAVRAGGLRLLAEDDRSRRRGRGRDRILHHVESPARGGPDLLEVGERGLLAAVAGVVGEELRVADDLVEGSPQVVPQARPRVDLRVAHGAANRGVITRSLCRKMKWSK
jgi:hypothetical protein